MKTCIACGMPMKETSDFAMADINKDYCVFCANKDGSMQSFDEKLAGLTAFIIKSQGLAPEVASKAALESMKKLPAWKSNFPKA